MRHVTDYPIEVLEAYDIIEKLFTSEDNEPITSYNTTASDMLLYLLDSLYQSVPGEPKF